MKINQQALQAIKQNHMTALMSTKIDKAGVLYSNQGYPKNQNIKMDGVGSSFAEMNQKMHMIKENIQEMSNHLYHIKNSFNQQSKDISFLKDFRIKVMEEVHAEINKQSTVKMSDLNLVDSIKKKYLI